MFDFITSSTSILITIAVFLLIFGVLIVLHELGHFWAARAAKVQVQEFGFGMPPKLFGIQTTKTLSKGTADERTETMQWTVNAIPFGGFVRMLGEHEDSGNPYAFGNRPLFWRMLVIWGGVIMNFLLGWALLSIALGIGIDPNPTSKEEYDQFVEQGLITEKTGYFVSSTPTPQNNEPNTIQPGDKVISINGSNDILEQNPIKTLTVERFLSDEKVFQEYQFTLANAEAFNLSQLHITQIIESGPAYAAGLRKNDILKNIGGQEIQNSRTLYQYIIGQIEKNEPIILTVQRENQEYSVEVMADTNGKIGIGWGYQEHAEGITLIQNTQSFIVQDLKYPWIQTPIEGLKYSKVMIEQSFNALTGLISQLTSSFSIPDGIGGPVAIAHQTDTILKYGDIMHLVIFTAMLSLSLAVLNIMPFPGLDGGRFVFLVIEGLLIIKAWIWVHLFRSKTKPSTKVSPSIEGWINAIGFIVLMGLLIWITGKDILKLFL